MFENRVPSKILGPKRDESIGMWRRLHKEELHGLYYPSNTIWVIKSRRMRWPGHVAHTEQTRDARRVLVGKPEGKRPLGKGRAWTGLVCLSIGTGGGLL
jgi:hypothetical protein